MTAGMTFCGSPVSRVNPNKNHKNMFLYSFILLLSFFHSGCMVEGAEPNIIPATDPQSLADKLAAADWQVEEINEGLTLKYEQFHDLFGSTQSITILEVDLKQEDVQVKLDHVESGFLKTSDSGRRMGATAAVNGSFFDTKVGGSTVFLKRDGRIITPTREGFTPYRENAGFGITASGEVSIVAKPDTGWERLEEYTELLASGPLLVKEDTLVEQVEQAFNTNRHPRTAIGLTADGRLLAVVVDGRNAEAHGMSIGELAELMQALGCTEAMNLDGGGSSTAWVQTQGVVNYPSDNKLYDHGGERGVATVIGFMISE